MASRGAPLRWVCVRRFSLLGLLLLAAAVDARPQRIVSMNPCTDAILVRVADAAQIAAISHWSHDARATSLPLAVANRFPAQFGSAEEVIALRPDLVILSPHTPLATRTALARLRVPMLAIGVPASVAESLQQIRAIADAAGFAARGAVLAGGIARAVAQTPARPPVSALIRMGSGTVPGAGTLADELLRRAGFANASSTFGLQTWDMLPVERLVTHAPALLLTDRPKAQHPVVARAGIRVADFPAWLLNCGGPTIPPALARLAQLRATLP